MERLDRPGPGFAPAMDDRGTAMWRGVAIGCGALSMLGFGSVVSVCIVLMVWLSGLAGSGPAPGPADPAPANPVLTEPNNHVAGGEKVVVQMTGTEGVRF